MLPVASSAAIRTNPIATLAAFALFSFQGGLDYRLREKPDLGYAPFAYNLCLALLLSRKLDNACRVPRTKPLTDELQRRMQLVLGMVNPTKRLGFSNRSTLSAASQKLYGGRDRTQKYESAHAHARAETTVTSLSGS